MATKNCKKTIATYVDLFNIRDKYNYGKSKNFISSKVNGKDAELSFLLLEDYDDEIYLTIDGKNYIVLMDNRTGKYEINADTGYATVIFKSNGDEISLTFDYAKALYQYWLYNGDLLDLFNEMECEGVEFTDTMEKVLEEANRSVSSPESNRWGRFVDDRFEEDILECFLDCISRSAFLQDADEVLEYY